MRLSSSDALAHKIQNIALKMASSSGFENVTLEGIAQAVPMSVEDLRDIVDDPIDAILGNAVDGSADLVAQILNVPEGKHHMTHFFDATYEWFKLQETDPVYTENRVLLAQVTEQNPTLQGHLNKQNLERFHGIADIVASFKGWDSGDVRASVLGSLISGFLFGVGVWMEDENASSFSDAFEQFYLGLKDVILQENFTEAVRGVLKEI